MENCKNLEGKPIHKVGSFVMSTTTGNQGQVLSYAINRDWEDVLYTIDMDSHPDPQQLWGKYLVEIEKPEAYRTPYYQPNDNFYDVLSKGSSEGCVEPDSIVAKHPHIDEEFKRLQGKMYQIFAKKMLDYGKDNISMGTALETDEEKKMALTAAWTRMWDKMNRLKNLVVKGNEAQVNERIEDTYMDLANYALISLLVLNDDWK